MGIHHGDRPSHDATGHKIRSSVGAMSIPERFLIIVDNYTLSRELDITFDRERNMTIERTF